MNLTKFYINGEFTDPSSSETLGIINPATEEEIGIVALGTIEDVDRAVYSARKAFSVSSKLSKTDRLDILKIVRENYKKRFNDLSEAIRLEMGAPIKLAEGAQAATGLGHLKTAIRVLENHEFEYKHGDYIVREEPIGVCGLITPWNWPINQIVSKVAPAFAAGCTVILKPSEIAPLSAMIIAEIMHESKIPAGMFNLINGLGNIVGEAMSAHKDIDMMSFTGSTRGGVAVATASAATVKRVSQELGGKSANIILDDDSFTKSITNGVTHVMSNTGQSCNAPTRMLVPLSRHDEALDIAKNAVENIKVGKPDDINTDLGPLVSITQYNKVQNLIKKGIEEGAQLVSGGKGKPDGFEKGYYVKPTIFGNVSNNMIIAKEEIFGPVLSIIPYDDIEHAVSIANDTVYGLAAYVTGEDQKKCLEVARELRAGQISLNYGSSGPSAPFGGYKQSGNGREKAEWGLDEFLEIKAIMGS
ncbi:MAG: aldehyde dehydrogenase family protein [Pseudomonadota bacterium]|nr:aldehyde dehydrogenase family protein [Pseudomonadota bacterium]